MNGARRTIGGGVMGGIKGTFVWIVDRDNGSSNWSHKSRVATDTWEFPFFKCLSQSGICVLPLAPWAERLKMMVEYYPSLFSLICFQRMWLYSGGDIALYLLKSIIVATKWLQGVWWSSMLFNLGCNKQVRLLISLYHSSWNSMKLKFHIDCYA